MLSSAHNYENCIVVHVDKEIDESNLEEIFSNKQITGGGDIEILELNANRKLAFIYYKNNSDKQRVLMQKAFSISGYKFDVKPYKPQEERSRSKQPPPQIQINQNTLNHK
jgi:hypothetical protein